MAHIPRSKSAGDVSPMWLERALPQLVDFIVTTYHEPLRKDLAWLNALIAQVQVRATRRAHFAAQQAILSKLWACFWVLKEELEAHLDKEEKVLFPWIRAGRGVSARVPIKVMQHEHRQTEELLHQIQHLRDQYVLVPKTGEDEALLSIFKGLAELDASLQEHVRLEDFLFLRTLAS